MILFFYTYIHDIVIYLFYYFWKWKNKIKKLFDQSNLHTLTDSLEIATKELDCSLPRTNHKSTSVTVTTSLKRLLKSTFVFISQLFLSSNPYLNVKSTHHLGIAKYTNKTPLTIGLNTPISFLLARESGCNILCQHFMFFFKRLSLHIS